MKFSGNEVALGTLALALGAVFLLLPDDGRSIAAPAFTCILLVAWLWFALFTRNGEAPLVDVGMLCALATLIYTVYPIANYALDGMQFGILADNRLMNYQIQPAELGMFHWRHALYLSCFVTAYYFSGYGEPSGVVNIDPPGKAVIKSILVVIACLTAYFLALKFMYGVDFNSSYEENAFEGNYATLQALPLFVKQMSGKLRGILSVAKLTLLCLVVSRAKEKKWLYILFAWGAAETLQLFAVRGARSEFVLFMLAAVLYYNRMIRRLPLKTVFISAIGLFVFFTFMGLYRTYSNIASMSSELIQEDTNLFATGNEFQALFGTAYDVYHLKESGVNLPWYLYINDFIGLLPPQQVIPFEKVSASEWYMREINYSGSGLGLMWGVISQSIIGFDWAELALRGGILGFILARFHRWYLGRRTGLPETVLYVFFCIRIYYTFRDTTFGLLANVLWEVIPFWLIVRMLTDLQEKKQSRIAVC